MEQQRIVVGPGLDEVPARVLGELLCLAVDVQVGVVGDQHRIRGVPPRGRLLGVDPEGPRLVQEALGGVGRRHQIPLRHQVRVDVVVGDRAVLVGAGDAVDPEPTLRVVMAQGPPKAGGLDQQLQPGRARELLVVGRVLVPDHRVGDVGIDVERRRARRPVARALLAADRPPGERRPPQPELAGALARRIQGRMPPAEGVGGGLRRRVGEHRQHVRLAVPEGVPVIARPRQALGRDRPPLAARPRLQRVKEREPDRLLQLGVAVEADVGAPPEVVQVAPLIGQQTVPAGVRGLCERGRDLVADGGHRALARPAVGEELDDPQPLAGRQLRADREPGEIGLGLDVRAEVAGPVERVDHARRHPQFALMGAVHQDGAGVGGARPLGCEGLLQRRRRTRVLLHARLRLVGDQLRLDDDPNGLVDRLDLVGDRRHRSLRERDEAGRADLDDLVGGRAPLHLAVQGPRPQVERALVGSQLAVADVQGLVPDQQPDHLAVGEVDDRLAHLGLAVGGFGIRQRALLEEPVQVGAGQRQRLPLIEIAAQADVTVGEREHGLGLRQEVEIEAQLGQRPGLDGEVGVADHFDFE